MTVTGPGDGGSDHPWADAVTRRCLFWENEDMDIIDFVRERAAEDAVLCRAVDPVDVDLLYASHIAERLIQVCGGHYDRLTPRQRQVLWQLAERHRSHEAFNPIWCLEEHHPGQRRPRGG